MTTLIHRLLAASLALAACGAHAAPHTIASSREGAYWNQVGYTAHSGPQAAKVGVDESPSGPNGFGGVFEHRAYLVFDLGAQSALVTAATLRIKVDSYVSEGGGIVDGKIVSNIHHDTEPFGVFAVATPLADLTADHGDPGGLPGYPHPNPQGLAIWDDLGSGTQWGSFLASSSSAGSFVDVLLTPAGVAALNAARGSSIAFGLGFTGEQLGGLGGQLGVALAHQLIGIDTGDSAHQLVVSSVPEPAGAWLALPGAALLLMRRKDSARA